jgi:hypothetical protein
LTYENHMAMQKTSKNNPLYVLFSELTALAVGAAWMPGGKDSTGVCAEQATGHVQRGMLGRPYAPL